MRGLNLSEEFGVILLSLAVYDFVNGNWAVFGGAAEQGFGLAKWILLFALLFVLVVSLSITHRTNSSVASHRIIEAGKASEIQMKRHPWLFVLPSAVIAATLLITLLGLSNRTTFLVWSGIGFINLGPWMEKWVDRIVDGRPQP
jgi:hypothetical protein